MSTEEKPKQKPANRVVTKVIQSKMVSGNMGASFNGGIGAGYPIQTTVDFAKETGRRGAETIGLGGGPASVAIANVTVARRRSRHAVLTNPYAKRGVDILVSNVVGTGHRLISMCSNEELRKQIEDLWEEWCEVPDVSGKLSMSGIEELAFKSSMEGGDSFVRMRTRRPEDNLPVPLQLQLLESEQVPISMNQMNGGNKILAGIEFGPIGNPVAYHIHRNHPGELSSFELTQAIQDIARVPADQIAHIHDVRRPNEVRGFPVLSQSLIQLSDLDRYLDAELVRKKAAALIGGFIRKPIDGQNIMMPMVTGEEDDTEIHIEAMEPGSFPILPEGYDVSFSAPADVGANFAVFVKQQLLMVSAAINVTYEQLTNDLTGANDRTLRASMLEFKRIATQYQRGMLVHQLLRPVFSRWMDLAILSGALKLPAGVTLRDAKRVRWVADPWEYMNPLQDINAKILEVRAGFTSRSEIIIQNGGVPEDTDKQIRADRDREEQLDLVFTTNPGVVSNAGVSQASDPSKTLKDDGNEEEPEQTEEGNQNGA